MASAIQRRHIVIAVALAAQAAYIAYLQLQLHQLACDIGDSVFAERRIFYPAIKAVGLNPDELGTEATNPFTTLSKYASRCDHKNAVLP